ncbi:hypothetical protein [Nocardia sp. IFM 10818]
MSANPSQSSERPKTLSQRLRELNPEGRYSGKASGWGLADEVFTELIADGLDPAVVTDKVHRGSRNGYQAALLMRSIHDNARRAAAEQGAAAPDPVPAAPPQQPATAAPEPAPVATDGEQAAAAPGSYGQRMAYLMLSVALHKARVQREQIDQASELRARVDAITERSDERMGMEAELQYMDQELAAAREQAQQRLNTTEW